MSIKYFFKKIKDKIDIDRELILCLFILIIISFASFGLGRLSVLNINLEKNSNISISYRDNHAINNNINKRYVGSKNGKLYYPINCSFSNKILSKNKIYFRTINDAIKSGYNLSTSCK